MQISRHWQQSLYVLMCVCLCCESVCLPPVRPIWPTQVWRDISPGRQAAGNGGHVWRIINLKLVSSRCRFLLPLTLLSCRLLQGRYTSWRKEQNKLLSCSLKTLKLRNPPAVLPALSLIIFTSLLRIYCRLQLRGKQDKMQHLSMNNEKHTGWRTSIHTAKELPGISATYTKK